MSETRLRWNTKLGASCRVFGDFADMYSLCSFQQIHKIGESEARIQRWMELLSAYNFRFSYRRGRDNVNTDFPSRLQLPPTEEGISGPSALSDPDDLGDYLIHACG